MQQYEYKSLTLTWDDPERREIVERKALNEHGRRGYELVCVWRDLVAMTGIYDFRRLFDASGKHDMRPWSGEEEPPPREDDPPPEGGAEIKGKSHD